jgi:hypothetical protein
MASESTCRQAIESYLTNLRSETQVSRVEGDRCYIVTPFMRPDGDFIEVELQPRSGRVLISDMGDTLGYLHVNGLAVTASIVVSARKISKNLGVSFHGYELEILCEPNTIGGNLNLLVQAIVSVSNLIHKKRPYEPLRFETEVEAFLVQNRVVYDSDFEVSGANENHHVRFHVNSDKWALVQPVSAASESGAHAWAERWAYRFGDMKQAQRNWNAFAILDDRGNRESYWTDRTIAPLHGHAEVVPWRDNKRLAEALSGQRLG